MPASITIVPDYPAVGDVTDGVEYDYGNLTGTLAVGCTPEPTGLAYYVAITPTGVEHYGKYLSSCFSAYEFNEAASPAIDSIAGKELTLGTLQTLADGRLAWPNSAVLAGARAVSNDTTAHLVSGTPYSIEFYIEFATSTIYPSIATIKTETTSGAAVILSTDAAVATLFIGSATTFGVSSEPDIPYAPNTPYHGVITYSGAVGLGQPGIETAFTFYLNGVKALGEASIATNNMSNVNAVGLAYSLTKGEGSAQFIREYNKALTDSEAAQLYSDRGSFD